MWKFLPSATDNNLPNGEGNLLDIPFMVMFPDLAAEVIDRTKTMADVYGALFDFSCILKPKIDIRSKCNRNIEQGGSNLEGMQRLRGPEQK
ncbi:hypothetical protein SLA2020_054340 [Shorea laevis]